MQAFIGKAVLQSKGVIYRVVAKSTPKAWREAAEPMRPYPALLILPTGADIVAVVVAVLEAIMGSDATV